MTGARDTLVFMACSATKLDTAEAVPMHELYTGPMWQTLKSHMGAIAWGDVFVLSGKYGFRSSRVHVRTYEERISAAKVDALLERGVAEYPAHKAGVMPSGPTVLQEIETLDVDGTRRAYRRVIIAGAGEYRRAFLGLVEQLKAEGVIAADAIVQCVEGRLGEQRSCLKRFLAEANAAPAEVEAPIAAPAEIEPQADEAAELAPAAIVTPGTRLVWSTLGEWIEAADAIAGRRCSRHKYRAADCHFAALPLAVVEAAPAAEVEQLVALLQHPANIAWGKPPRGHRGDTKWEALNVAARNRLQRLAREADLAEIPTGANAAAFLDELLDEQPLAAAEPGPFAGLEDRAEVRLVLRDGRTLAGAYMTVARMHFLQTAPAGTPGGVEGPFDPADVERIELQRSREEVIAERFERARGEPVPGQLIRTRAGYEARLDRLARAAARAEDYHRRRQIRQQFADVADEIHLAQDKRRWLLAVAAWATHSNREPTRIELANGCMITAGKLKRTRPQDFDPDPAERRRRAPIPARVLADPMSIRNVTRTLRAAGYNVRPSVLADEPTHDAAELLVDFPGGKEHGRFMLKAERGADGRMTWARPSWDGNGTAADAARRRRCLRGEEFRRFLAILAPGQAELQPKLAPIAAPVDELPVQAPDPGEGRAVASAALEPATAPARPPAPLVRRHPVRPRLASRPALGRPWPTGLGTRRESG